MVRNILEIGEMTNKMVMVKKNGRMEPSIRATIRQEKSKGKGHLSGVMIAPMKVILIRIIFMAKVSMFGKTVVFMKVNGITTKCMEKVHSLGQMVASMKVNT
jgi:hypothetical protein